MKLRNSLIEMVHTGMTGGHLGFEKTKKQVRRRAYWPGFSNDVFRYCRECEACSRYKRGPAPKQGLLEPLITGNVMERLSIDITGLHPISSAGHKFLLTVVDHFSKWVEAFPIRNQEASTIAKLFVDRVFCCFGMPIQILTDQGKNFESELFSELCRCLDVEKIRTTIYKPSTNGVVERFHRTLNSMIGKIIHDNHRNWHELIPQILAAYRASEHSATGYSPNKLMLGRECRAPIDLVLGTLGDANINISYNEYVKQMRERMLYCYESVRHHLSVAAERRKRSYDMSVRPKQFQIGQKVLYYYPRRYRFRSPKWQKMYIGPYKVVRQLGPLNYVIKKCKGRQEIIAHIDKMKPYLGHLYDPQEDTSYHDTPDNYDIGPPNTDTLNERLGTVNNPPTTNLSPRPARSRKLPGKYRDFVLFTRKKTNRPYPARPAPTPRPCRYCGVELNGKREQVRHVQNSHRDILEANKKKAQDEARLLETRTDLIRYIRTATRLPEVTSMEEATAQDRSEGQPPDTTTDDTPASSSGTESSSSVSAKPTGLELRITNIRSGKERSELHILMSHPPEVDDGGLVETHAESSQQLFIPGPMEPAREVPVMHPTPAKEGKKSEIMSVVGYIDKLAHRFPKWSDDMILAAVMRFPKDRDIPKETLKGIIQMKTVTTRRLTEMGRKVQVEKSVQVGGEEGEEVPANGRGIKKRADRESDHRREAACICGPRSAPRTTRR